MADVSPLKKDEARAEYEAFSDWAWMKPGDAIGVMHSQLAAREAWMERAARARHREDELLQRIAQLETARGVGGKS